MTIDELVQYFELNKPESDIWLNNCELIRVNNFDKFVKSHVEFLRSNSKNKAFLPYYNRLIDAKKVINELNKVR